MTYRPNIDITTANTVGLENKLSKLMALQSMAFGITKKSPAIEVK